MLPNGGFPPIRKCSKNEEKKSLEEQNKKGFFYQKNSNIDIKTILMKKIKSPIETREEEELDIID
tara:strand:- start:1464 stop:1658 length:195 start_codon:yes stop_codon:yes gene_type:complete